MMNNSNDISFMIINCKNIHLITRCKYPLDNDNYLGETFHHFAMFSPRTINLMLKNVRKMFQLQIGAWNVTSMTKTGKFIHLKYCKRINEKFVLSKKVTMMEQQSSEPMMAHHHLVSFAN